MKRKIPLHIYLKIVVGFIFSFIILWYFSFRLLTPFTMQTRSMVLVIGIPIVISVLLCLFLVKRTIKKELEIIDVPFSLVARNPSIEIPKEKLSIKILTIRMLIAFTITVLLTLPFSIISILKTLVADAPSIKRLLINLTVYRGFFIFFMIFSIFLVFAIYPSLKRWHWTKHQFG